MKQNWDPEELIEHFTILPPERELIGTRTETVRAGFAVLLKFFQYQSRFPYDPSEIPDIVVDFIAKQVGSSIEAYKQYE